MDYLRVKFGVFSFSRFGFIVRTDRITEADQRHTHATTISVSKALFPSKRNAKRNASDCVWMETGLNSATKTNKSNK